MKLSRREIVTAGALGLLSFQVAGVQRQLTPAQARAAAVPFNTLEPTEVTALERLGEILLPGAAVAGLAHYIDHQLSGPAQQSMLMLKYLRVNPPFAPFYQQGLAAAEAAAAREFRSSLSKLDDTQGRDLVSRMSAGSLAGWQGPPSPAVYFVLRNDAVDVVYGTEAGFARLHTPYMAHIPPPTPWGRA